MLRVESLRAGYGKVEVIRGVTMDVPRGEITSIIGPNGAGKSTLLKSIVGLAKVMDGRIIYDGMDITHIGTEEMANLGIVMVLEGARIFPDMTVHENLLMGAYPKRARGSLESTLSMVFEVFPNLKGKLHQMAGTLSGGERKALSLGMALMAKPELLIVDELSLGLHPKMVMKVFGAIEEIKNLGVTVLMAEQNASLPLKISKKAFVLEGGRITLEGSGKELLGNPHVRKAYLSV